MSNNSLPDIANELDSAKIKNPKSVVPSIYVRLKEYLAADISHQQLYDNQEKIHKLKYTVVRQYLQNLLLTLRSSAVNNKRNTELMQLKTILNSQILNGMEYALPIRFGKFLVFLNQICENDSKVNSIVDEWDHNVVYF
jgi:hypothetical protein